MDDGPIPSVPERWFYVDDLADYLGVKRDTVYKWIMRRSLPAHKAGRLWKFRRDEVDACKERSCGEKGEQEHMTTEQARDRIREHVAGITNLYNRLVLVV